nr:glutathione S-transferase family protein [uncultured Celeribacter sp.]
MKLYHSPGSCSEGILLLLEACGAPYEVVVTDLKTGAHRDADYLALNPKGKVPALMLADGTVLTEWPIIAYWLAKSYPEVRLLPKDLEEEIQVMTLTEHIVSGLHMRGSVFAMMPQKFVSDAPAQAELRRHGQSVVRAGFDALAQRLADQDCLFDTFSIADAAAYYLISWKDRIGVEPPAALEAYYQRLRTRFHKE